MDTTHGVGSVLGELECCQIVTNKNSKYQQYNGMLRTCVANRLQIASDLTDSNFDGRSSKSHKLLKQMYLLNKAQNLQSSVVALDGYWRESTRRYPVRLIWELRDVKHG